MSRFPAKAHGVRRYPEQRGFSLLETLVAFSVLAVCLGVLLRVFGGGGRAAALTDDYARGLTVAESLLASLGTEKALVPGRQEGIVGGGAGGGIRWVAQVAPLPVPTGETSDLNFSFLPYWVEVTVNWGEGERGTVKLSTVRLLSTRSPTSSPGDPAVRGVRGGVR